jgi:hypothetical protein
MVSLLLSWNAGSEGEYRKLNIQPAQLTYLIQRYRAQAAEQDE